MDKIKAFWETFLIDKQLNKDTIYDGQFHFELTENSANELLELVLIGQKKATASSYESYLLENQKLPKVGDLNIITDFYGNPKGVIKTTKITILPFKDLTFDIVKREGEDDTLESWQKNHRKFFTQEGKELGYTFNEDMKVLFEDFKLIYKIKS